MNAQHQNQRIRFAVKVRTMLLLVAAVAATLGFADWWKRRSVVQALVSRVPVSVFIRSRPTYPNQDPTYDPGGTFRLAVRRVHELQQDGNAVAALRKELRTALDRRDEKAMRGALAALMYLGPPVAAAGPEVLAVIQLAARKSEPPAYLDDARMFAVHVLGIVAKEDRAYVNRLLDTLLLPDSSRHRVVFESAANELQPFIEDNKVSPSRILTAVEESIRQYKTDPGDPHDFRTGDLIALVGGLSTRPGAFEIVIPRLKELVKDRSLSGNVRHRALWSISWLYQGRRSLTALGDFSHYLDELENDPKCDLNMRTVAAIRHNTLLRELELGGKQAENQVAESLRKLVKLASAQQPSSEQTAKEIPQP